VHDYECKQQQDKKYARENGTQRTLLCSVGDGYPTNNKQERGVHIYVNACDTSEFPLPFHFHTPDFIKPFSTLLS